eukprot:710651-Pelagomonas_calceolata.AAC.3
METIETLQAGAGGEADQRMLSLTAQLAAARAHEKGITLNPGQHKFETQCGDPVDAKHAFPGVFV